LTAINNNNNNNGENRFEKEKIPSRIGHRDGDYIPRDVTMIGRRNNNSGGGLTGR